LAGVN